MIWPINTSGTRVISAVPDEAGGELLIRAVFGMSGQGGELEQDIVYEGMFYSQLDESSAGLIIDSVAELTPDELKLPEHESAAARLYADCGADDYFLRDMYRRGNRLFTHRARGGGEYIVLAKRQAFGEQRAKEW